ncbi:MAG: ATP-binding protein [Bacteroidales bacterium]|nr:ATP-binding protein [Candidatus Colimorpha onthohippi]
MKIIGREKEQKKLQEIIASTESEFVAVYGRRRVGKTYLIRQMFKDNLAFSHTGIANADKRTQLSRFCNSLSNYSQSIKSKPTTWFAAFDLLKQYLERLSDDKKIIFLDEMPWMDTPKSNFLSALENFWNGWAATRGDIILIVCGSATSWIINKLIRNHGGLHNRITKQIHLQPFSLYECEQYASYKKLGMGRQAVLETYMALGGIPYYWNQLERFNSVAQNMDCLFFNENATLKDEYNALFASLFAKPTPHIAIVRALCNKKIGMTRNEILQSTHLTDNIVFRQALAELTQCGFIRQYNSIGKKVKETIYQIIDFYILFHHHFIEGQRSSDSNYWSHHIGQPKVTVWYGLAFEKVCLMHSEQIKQALGISGIASECYAWRTPANDNHPGAQIDLLIDRSDKVINICETKYHKVPFCIDRDYASALQQKADIFRNVTATRKAIHITMITANGLQHNEYWQTVQQELTIDQLFLS